MDKVSKTGIEPPSILITSPKPMRVLMHIDDQRRFVRTIKMRCNLTWRDFGKLCGVKGPTAKVNYFFKGRTLPLEGALYISFISGVPLPPHRILPANWGQIKGGQKTLQKFSFKNPTYSEELAELLGILMGDGCIFKSRNKKNQKEGYFILITGHSREFEYYETIIRPIFVKLFDVRGYLYKRRGQNTLRFITKSRRIYEFLKLAGMPEGTKNKSETFAIPNWITANPDFTKACIRGLTDTDGAVFKSHGRWINIYYKFASNSLVQSLHAALVKLGYHPTRIGKVCTLNPESGRTSVCWQFYLSRRDEIRKFANEIGFDNPLLNEKYRNANLGPNTV